MRIKIEQTLHSYENGHQLLMSSTSLSSDAKQTLLVQSDLSGSNIDENFKVYISGYPLASYYAFSKTWYADEMRRPGCVWTQTFLIAFADLGKIPDLEQLTELFKRPVKDEYDTYGFSIYLDREDLRNSAKSFDETLLGSAMLKAVYEQFDKTIIISAFSSSDPEKEILQLWSNQWPRLRRNFSFCSGALNLKTIEGRREFDLQVVPRRSLITVEKQSAKPYILEMEKAGETPWISILYHSSKNQLRKFLWQYGSDIPGTRRNYRPLIILYGETLKERPSFELINELINTTLANPGEGVQLKNRVYNDNDLFKFNTREVLNYLITADETAVRNLDELDLTGRLLNAYHDGEINLKDFADFYANAAPDRLSGNLWDSLAANETDLLSVISQDTRLLKVFANRLPEIAVLEVTWKRPFDIQQKILYILESIKFNDWEPVIGSILSAGSPVIYQLLKYDPQRVYLLLKWLNANGYKSAAELEGQIFNEFKRIFIDFVHESWHALSEQTCNYIFQKLNLSEINAIDLDGSKWMVVYRQISHENSRIFASCVLLSFGFNRKVVNPAGLVLGCFSDVYYYAKSSRVSGNDWGILPVDMSEEDEDTDTLGQFFNFINLFSPKKSDVPSWDYCELLIRTLVNKFIKYSWPQKAFLECLSTPELTEQAIRYCAGFKKGNKFLKGIITNIENHRIYPAGHQVLLINALKNR